MKVVEELKRDVENADAEKLEFLQRSVNPVYWFLLLAEYPEFAPDSTTASTLNKTVFIFYLHWFSVKP